MVIFIDVRRGFWCIIDRINDEFEFFGENIFDEFIFGSLILVILLIIQYPLIINDDISNYQPENILNKNVLLSFDFYS